MLNGSVGDFAASKSLETGRRSRLGRWLHVYGPALWPAIVLLAALYYYFLSTQIRFAPRPGRLGPAFWPQVILVLLIITAAVDCFTETRKARNRAASSGANLAGVMTPRVWWLMALGLAVTLAYVNLATVLGFALANFLFMLAFMLLGGFHRPIAALAISAVGTLTLMMVFVRIVYVSLPLGMPPFENLTILLYSLLGIA
jgi:hypothetical protein